MLPGMEERECASEAILLSPEVFFQLNHPFSDVWNFKRSKIKVNAYSFARWKRPKASTLGLQKLLDYDEMYSLQYDKAIDKQPTVFRRQWAKM